MGAITELEHRDADPVASPRVRLSSPDCVKILDRDGRVESFNDDGLQLMEIDELSAVAGRFWPDLWPDDTRSIAIEALDGARAKGVATFAAPCPTAKGTLKWWDVTVAAIPGAAGSFCVISRDITETRATTERAALDEQRRNMALAGSGGVGLWDWMVDTDLLHGDANFARLYGLDVDKTASGLTEYEYQEFVVPEDLQHLRASIRAVFERGEDFLVEYRLEVPGQPLRWVECKGKLITGEGDRSRFSGTAVDITHRKRAEEQKQLLMQELSHRVKNSFALVQATALQTLKGIDPGRLSDFQARLTALAHAHDVLLEAEWKPAPIRTIVERVLGLAENSGRFDVTGPDVTVTAEAALSLSLLLHELMTNAVKYGALSVERGRVELAWHIEGETFTLSWTERGGAPAKEPVRTGFGSRLLGMGICGSRRAELSYGGSGFRGLFEAPVARVCDKGVS